MAQELGGASRRHLRTLFNVGVTAGLTDGQLLERFATAHGEASEMAFGALVERHGPMVLRTCRGVLRDDHEAHDAFQATFLILVRRSGTLWVRDSLGPWLHRVACRAAGRARAAAARRRAIERQAGGQPIGRPASVDVADLAAIIHEEVDRLPERYRVPVVLCDLEGRSQEDAARHLGCPAGTVKSRLARGRDRLRGRLLRRGLAPAAALHIAVDAAAALPEILAESTFQSAHHLTAAVAAGTVPASVAELAEGVLTMMFHGKLKLLAAGVFTAVGLAFAVGTLAQPAAKEPAQVAPQKQVRDPVGDRRWIKSFPNGTTIEVVGISTYPSGPNSWWAPDGRPLEEAPCDPCVSSVSGGGNDVYRAMAVRITGKPEGAVAGWGVREARGSSVQPAKRAGKELPDLFVGVFLLSPNQQTCSVNSEVASGPWKTVETAGKGSSAIGRMATACIFSEVIATKAGVTRVVTHNIQDAEVRLVAVDREGKERLPVGRSGSGAGGFYQMLREFDLAPDQVDEFRLQTRTYEHLEIKDVALERSGDL